MKFSKKQLPINNQITSKVNFKSTFKVHDEYRSPNKAWDDILKYIDPNKLLTEK